VLARALANRAYAGSSPHGVSGFAAIA
jgi:hypothetical protein